MKDFFVHRTARGLIIPVLIVICVLLAGAGSARAGKNAPVEVGFIGVPPIDQTTGKPMFQNVLLNVQAVRINTNANAGPGSGKWQVIPTPPGIGGASQNAELQIDLNTSQSVPQLYNTANVQPNTYKVAQIILDPNNPGTLIPNCPVAPPVGATNDGCINYPIQLANGQVINTPPITGFSASSGSLAQLFLKVTMKVTQAPLQAGAPYTVSVTIAPDADPVVGAITGTVSGGGTGSTKNVRKLAVTAETIGTNTAIATAQVKNGMYTLVLPAAGPAIVGSAFGSLYDLAVAGGGATYAAKRLPPLYPVGTFAPVDFAVTANQTLGNVTGQITDNCVAGKPVIGATLQLLIPPDSIANTKPPPPQDFCLPTNANPNANLQCIAVATANTDNAGNFPLPGTISTPSEFDSVPELGKNQSYVMEITASGYDPLFVLARPNTGGGKKSGGSCSVDDGMTFGKCNFGMNTGYITGTIPVTPPIPGQTVMVQVLAEDHGTNTIESALPMPLAVTSTSNGTAGFTLNVPPSKGPFDLFSTTIDQYQGASDPYPGHTVAVLANVTGPAEPSAPGACSTATATFEESIDCVGHGSITGVVNNANLGTSVVLSKQDMASDDFVQIMSSEVQNQTLPLTNSTDTYAFCAPADTYWLQTVQMPMASPSETPSVAPTSEPTGSPSVSVTIPPPSLFHGPTPTPSATPTGGPTPTATPTGGPVPTASPTPKVKCPTTCTNPDGSCPGLCNTVSGVNL